MTLLIDHPGLMAVPILVLLALWWRSRSTMTVTAAGLWAVYLIWEVLVIREDRPDANIRIDLLLIYPLLVVITIAGLWTGRRARGTRSRTGRRA